jgi:hypothetical protein
MRPFSQRFLVALCLLAGLPALAQTAAPSVKPENVADGMIVNVGGVCVKAEVWASKRPVHLLETKGGWYDFWTGTNLPGGQTIDAPAPCDTLPLCIHAGSIIPTGPDLQYPGEKPSAYSFDAPADKTIRYSGKSVTETFK